MSKTMTDVSRKAAYMVETYLQIRHALKLKGCDISKNTPFRDYVDEIEDLNVELPQLNAPSISISNGVVTVTDNANNGNFTTGFAYYVDGNYIEDDDGSTPLNLYDYIKADGTYAITVKALGDNFLASEPSTSVNAVIEDTGSGYKATANDYGYTIQFKVNYRSIANAHGTTITLEDE